MHASKIVSPDVRTSRRALLLPIVALLVALLALCALVGCSSTSDGSSSGSGGSGTPVASGDANLISTAKVYNVQTSEEMATMQYTWDDSQMDITTSSPNGQSMTQTTHFDENGNWVSMGNDESGTLDFTVETNGDGLMTKAEADGVSYAFTYNGANITSQTISTGSTTVSSYEFNDQGFITVGTVNGEQFTCTYEGGSAEAPAKATIAYGDHTEHYNLTYDDKGCLSQVHCTEIRNGSEATWSGEVLVAEYTYAEKADAPAWIVSWAHLQPYNYMQLVEI